MHDAPRPLNRLAAETSPYLRQHAANPVDWYPWGPEALARARELDRPIFLSIGYAACHWCHVMERESFEDPATAADLNAAWVAVKVDREERPDLDALYMDAVQTLTGSGGWPMSVFCTPDGAPFHGGTYFPDRPRHGMPSFRQVLATLAEAWRTRRPTVLDAARRLTDAVASGQASPTDFARRVAQHAHAHDDDAGPGTAARAGGGRPGAGGTPPAGLVGPDGRPLVAAAAPAGADPAPLRAAVTALASAYVAHRGGWGGPPRFPQPMTIELLLREHARTGDPGALAMARGALDAMAAGGIHDHLGGGFARYATDDAWLVPHFEKMLYDNAPLARVYHQAWRLGGAARDRAVTEAALGWMAREMRAPADGAFASALDADTDGEEGATYTWSVEEIAAVLGAEAPLFAAAYGVTPGGNWEGHTILSRVRDDAALATTFGIGRDAVAARLADARARLLAARDVRPQPARDGKVLAAWNGLALAAFAEAGAWLPDGARWTAIATEAATFLLGSLRTPDGRLLRSWAEGRAQHMAVLEDHADLAFGLLALHDATGDGRWFTAARDLADLALARFAAPDGGFFDTADDAEALIARPRSLGDNAVPSGNAMLATVLLRLAALTGEGRYHAAAEAAIVPLAPVAARHPLGFAQWLIAYGELVRPPAEIAIVGDPADPATTALVAEVRRGYRTDRILAVAADPAASPVPLLAGRTAIGGRPTAYVCRGFVCRAPVTDPAALGRALADAG
ncbi:MAG: thioredoxin domain-containing protein [Chloroflexota bacterium]